MAGSPPRVFALIALSAACGAEGAPRTDAVSAVPQVTDTVVTALQQRWMGEVLFTESFDDAGFARRGWYDVDPGPRIVAGAFECRFLPGGTECADGTPGRRQFDGVEAIYVRYRVRYAADWQGSGRPYHPHEIYLLTNLDERWAGPAYTHLTVYIEQHDLHGQIALQDGRNVDAGCILRNDDVEVGCGGGRLADHPFGEARSVAACNGLTGPVQLRDCYPLGDGQWYSSRAWRTSAPVLGPGGGTDGWHRVETYIRLNSIRDGVAVADGVIRYAVDDVERLALDSLLFRTGRHAAMRLDQILIGPYIGDGSPVAQSMWIDDLTVARGRTP